MITKKEINKSLTAVEDIKSLYTQLEQGTFDMVQQQEFRTMLEDMEKHYLYLNSILLSFK